MNELCTKTATQLAGMIRAGDISSREAVDAHLERIEEVNGYVNAVTLTLADAAQAAAEAADNAGEADRARPFHGVPFTIKENIDLLGTPTTDGLPVKAEAMPTRNAPIVERMLHAGPSPWAAPTCPSWARALIPTIPCGDAPAILGTAA